MWIVHKEKHFVSSGTLPFQNCNGFKRGSDVSTVVGQPRHQTEMAMRASFSQVCMENPTMNMFQEL